jgi:tetratricopeptide (TPR) repeat protein
VQTTNDIGRPCRRPTWLLALPFLLVAVVLGPMLTPPAYAAPAASKHTDKREVEARKAFAAGRYQEALDLFTDLYADKPHPTYLRNVGRCYQNLKQPGKAINAFRDYLRQAKDLKDSERNEVNGFIAEMEALERQEKAEAAPPPASPPPTVPAVPPVAPEEQNKTRAAELTTQPAAEPEPSTPIYKKAWFWGVVGVVVAGAVVGGLYAGGVFSKSKLSCKAENGCFE